MKIKYPRTMHLDFSQGISSDDKVIKDLSNFYNKDIVVTEKFDGENTSLYNDGFHARSIDSRHHPSRDWLANFHASIAHNIPKDCRVCGENLYAKHSIAYQNLDSYFLGFSFWEDTRCLDWETTLEMFEVIGIKPVRTIFDGKFCIKTLKDLAKEIDTTVSEGFVVRLKDAFDYKDFDKSVVKWVRKGHVQTEKHWMQSEIIKNSMKIL